MKTFPTFTPKPTPKVAFGRGSWITDKDGNQVIDGSEARRLLLGSC